jgi:hypothetical protein
MQRTRGLEGDRQSVPSRGAGQSAPRLTPLTLVSGAVAGDDLGRVTQAVAEALGRPVVICIPAAGDPVVSPPGALGGEVRAEIAAYAAGVASGRTASTPDTLADWTEVRIGEQVVGIVALMPSSGDPMASGEERAWLQAAAAAASVTSLIGESGDDSAASLIRDLTVASPDEIDGLLARARRLGCELGQGATAIWAHRTSGGGICVTPEPGTLLAELGGDRVCALVPPEVPESADELAGRLRLAGMTVAVSAPRREGSAVPEALREAELLCELERTPGVPLAGHHGTFRLLIGVLLREPDELVALRESTIAPLAEYDRRHDTDLVATLQAFLTHDGSTTETAEAMNLHRHTVGYRLSRVHEVSGLSPYASEGRERLSLGLKAHQILSVAELS